MFLVFPTFKDSRRLHDVKGTSEKGPAKVLKRSHTNWISLTTYSPLGINIYARPSLTLKVVNLSFFIRAMTRIRLVREKKKKKQQTGGGGDSLEKKKSVQKNYERRNQRERTAGKDAKEMFFLICILRKKNKNSKTTGRE